MSHFRAKVHLIRFLASVRWFFLSVSLSVSLSVRVLDGARHKSHGFGFSSQLQNPFKTVHSVQNCTLKTAAHGAVATLPLPLLNTAPGGQ